MIKTPKPSTKATPRRKSALFDYYCDHSLRQQPISIVGLESLAEDLVNWALNDDTARKVRPFFNSKGITSRDIKRWSKRSKKFKHAYAIALAAVGDRREDGALIKKFDSSMVLKSMHRYDEDWVAIDKFKADLTNKSEQDQKTTTFNVKMTSYKKEEDDEETKAGDGS